MASSSATEILAQTELGAMAPPIGRLGRDGILSVADLPKEDVEIPEWSTRVYVRMMTARGARSIRSATVQIRV